MSEPENAKGPKVPPNYPPKTPPPPKRPVEAPRPSGEAEADTSALARPDDHRTATRDRVRMTVRNRRAASWTLPADRWAAGKAASRIVGAVRGWGYEHPGDESVRRSAELLVGAAVADGGKRISVHAADQDEMILIVVLSHRSGPAPDDDAFLTRVAAVSGTASCGSDAAEDGRRVWSLLDTRPRRAFGGAYAGRPGQD
ncbi:hypothetical protein [Streptomyces sp. H27-S2]|uniref:hypothetical protein n=1 Tax=Streptomyces antarcticus TaxID=2996458 RepID=UPI00226E1520|nr:hypothetical protein [Streptomyces sp. H27-S2]MCY0949813.1 hypothetical protein [Streptomyces sp. H27-S2]